MKRIMALLTAVLMLASGLLFTAGADGYGTDLTVNGVTYHLQLQDLLRSDSAIMIKVTGFDGSSSDTLAWATAVVGEDRYPARSLSMEAGGVYSFIFDVTEVPSSILIYPYGQYLNAVVLWQMDGGLETQTQASPGEVQAPASPEVAPDPTSVPDENYLNAIRFQQEEKYFSAYEAFLNCEAENRQELADACIQKWPQNGKIWHSPQARSGNTELTIQVNQESTRAMYIRIYQGDTALYGLFVGGTGKATVSLPGGIYTIKDGTGEKWFGVKEAFGRLGNYETMTFNKGTSERVTLKSGYTYTITINVQDSNTKGSGVGSTPEDWEGFSD